MREICKFAFQKLFSPTVKFREDGSHTKQLSLPTALVAWKPQNTFCKYHHLAAEFINFTPLSNNSRQQSFSPRSAQGALLHFWSGYVLWLHNWVSRRPTPSFHHPYVGFQDSQICTMDVNTRTLQNSPSVGVGDSGVHCSTT